jgi:hypothetical protein
VRIFTVAYGDGADRRVLEGIAAATRGYAVRGTSADIEKVFREVASFF